MKKNLLILIVMIFVTTGCSRTIHAVQQDSADAWENTKGAIHNATAPR